MLICYVVLFRVLLYVPVSVTEDCLDASLGHSRDTPPRINFDFLTNLSSQTQ